jgi:protein-S-isoprenylcysteine O-methyltransferase Ste14
MVVLLSDLFVLAGYLIFVRVMKENSYASSIIETNRDQKVIDTGPYKIVRHPMYAGILIMSIFTPVALGSYWALIPFLVGTPAVLVMRIKDEEKFLTADLPGYREYHRKTKYRLIPFLW